MLTDGRARDMYIRYCDFKAKVTDKTKDGDDGLAFQNFETRYDPNSRVGLLKFLNENVYPMDEPVRLRRMQEMCKADLNINELSLAHLPQMPLSWTQRRESTTFPLIDLLAVIFYCFNPFFTVFPPSQSVMEPPPVFHL
jgi:hypothetical protein